MKVIANVALCQGHARCADICPQVFANDDVLGKVVIKQQVVPAALEEDAMLAVNNCPEGALSVDEDDQAEAK